MCVSLSQAIKFINSTDRWGARVVYGDTDSVFVHMPGKTKDEAFAIGHEIADTITKMNPAPVKLKFEKVRFNLAALCIIHVRFQTTFDYTGLPSLRPRHKKEIRWHEV